MGQVPYDKCHIVIKSSRENVFPLFPGTFYNYIAYGKRDKKGCLAAARHPQVEGGGYGSFLNMIVAGNEKQTKIRKDPSLHRDSPQPIC